MQKIEVINHLLPWSDPEGDSNGYPITDPLIALQALRYGIRQINELDGKRDTYRQSGYIDIGDMSTLMAPGKLGLIARLQALVDFYPSFWLDETKTGLHNLSKDELYRVQGLEVALGNYTLYHQILNIGKGQESFYAGRLIRLNEADWAKLYW